VSENIWRVGKASPPEGMKKTDLQPRAGTSFTELDGLSNGISFFASWPVPQQGGGKGGEIQRVGGVRLAGGQTDSPFKAVLDSGGEGIPRSPAIYWRAGVGPGGGRKNKTRNWLGSWGNLISGLLRPRRGRGWGGGVGTRGSKAPLRRKKQEKPRWVGIEVRAQQLLELPGRSTCVKNAFSSVVCQLLRSTWGGGGDKPQMGFWGGGGTNNRNWKKKKKRPCV